MNSVENLSEQISGIFARTDVDRRLFTLRASHPELAFEIDEIARAMGRLRSDVAQLVESRTASK